MQGETFLASSSPPGVRRAERCVRRSPWCLAGKLVVRAAKNMTAETFRTLLLVPDTKKTEPSAAVLTVCVDGLTGIAFDVLEDDICLPANTYAAALQGSLTG